MSTIKTRNTAENQWRSVMPICAAFGVSTRVTTDLPGRKHAAVVKGANPGNRVWSHPSC